MEGLYFYIAFTRDPEHIGKIRIKIGLTTCDIHVRLDTYRTSDVYIVYFKVYTFNITTLDELFDIEKACLAATYKYGRLLDRYPSNECRYDEKPDTIATICEETFDLIGVKWACIDTDEYLKKRSASTEKANRDQIFTSYDELVTEHEKLTKQCEEKHNAMKQVNILRDYQKETYYKSVEYYKTNDKGLINWGCGLGKTITSLVIATKFGNKLLICVPSIRLIEQWKQTIKRILFYDDYDIFVLASSEDNDMDIHKWYRKYKKGIVISTYISASTKLQDYSFDFVIFDECHHLCSNINISNISSGYKGVFNIESKKQLSLTATMKQIINDDSIDNFDVKVFGSVIDSKSVKWSIDNKMITDYNVVTLSMQEEMITNIYSKFTDCNDKIEMDLFLAAYVALLSIHKYKTVTHMLLYVNEKKQAQIVEHYIQLIIESKIIPIDDDNIYYKSLTSDDKNIDDKIERFSRFDYGIIVCVYIFGEGFDLPRLNGVLIATNMESVIRIIQYCLRANRLDPNNPDKIANIIIPFIDNNEIYSKTDNCGSFKRVRSIINALRHDDDNIISKVKGGNISFKSSKSEESKYEITDITIDESIENVKLLLQHSKEGYSMQTEYDLVRYLNIKLRLSSIQDYESLHDKHKYYISNPQEYFDADVWVNWYHFLGLNYSKYPATKAAWSKRCKELNITSQTYNDQYKLHDDLPEFPHLLYNNFTNMSNELHEPQKRR